MSNQIARNSTSIYGTQLCQEYNFLNDQTITNNTPSPVIFDAPAKDFLNESGILSYDVGTGNFTTLKEGIFLIQLESVYKKGNNVGVRKQEVLVDAILEYALNIKNALSDIAFDDDLNSSCVIFLPVNTTFQMRVHHTGGANLDLLGTGTSDRYTKINICFEGGIGL